MIQIVASELLCDILLGTIMHTSTYTIIVLIAVVLTDKQHFPNTNIACDNQQQDIHVHTQNEKYIND